MPTNHLGRQTTDSGHVIKESERIAADVRSLFEKATMSENDGAVDTDLTLFDTDELINDIATYVMDYSYKDYAANVKFGVRLGRKDARAAYKDIFDWLLGVNGKFPESIPGARYNWRPELRERLEAADKALTEDTEETA